MYVHISVSHLLVSHCSTIGENCEFNLKKKFLVLIGKHIHLYNFVISIFIMINNKVAVDFYKFIILYTLNFTRHTILLLLLFIYFSNKKLLDPTESFTFQLLHTYLNATNVRHSILEGRVSRFHNLKKQ